MVDVRHVRTVRISWRKVGAALPALALIASGTALAATNASSPSTAVADQPVGASTQHLPRVEVPTQPVHEQATFLQSAIASPLPALALPTGMNALPAFGGVLGAPNTSSARVVLDRAGIPAPALAAYHRAADLLGTADAACKLDWAIPAAIGRVESNHARFGGNALDSAGVARPGIIGLPLNGTNGTSRIGDSDQGVWDRDTSWDRAVGPMQFIPGTWRSVGQDADGDGVANPQDMNDAATATAVYLCSGPGDLRDDNALYKAIFRYNQSDSYVKTVMNLAKAYRSGVTELPVSALPAATTSPAGSSNSDSGFGRSGAPVQAAGTPSASATQGQAAAAPAGQPAPAKAPQPPPQAAPKAGAPAATVPPLPPQVQQPISPATNAVKTVVAPVTSVAKVTLQRLSITLTQVVGKVLQLVPSQLPAPPASLAKVYKSTDPALAAACYTDNTDPITLVLGQKYRQVACPANTR